MLNGVVILAVSPFFGATCGGPSILEHCKGRPEAVNPSRRT